MPLLDQPYSSTCITARYYSIITVAPADAAIRRKAIAANAHHAADRVWADPGAAIIKICVILALCMEALSTIVGAWIGAKSPGDVQRYGPG